MENLEIIMEDYKNDDDVQIKINELLDLGKEYVNRKYLKYERNTS